MTSPDKKGNGTGKSDPSRKDWHAFPLEKVLGDLSSNVNGLTSSEAAKRLEVTGPNVIDSKRPDSFFRELLEELTEPMILLLLAVGVLYSIWGEITDAFTIFAVIIALISVEAFNDYRAGKTIHALRKLSEPNTLVRREGFISEMPIAKLVPGDIIVLQAGRKVPADGRVIESYGLQVDESLLTGESTPVDKAVISALDRSKPVAERSNMLFSGATVVRGRGSAVVVGTGMHTELGSIAALARGQKPPRTTLQLAMRDLTKWMVLLALSFSLLVPLLGVLIGHQELKTMVLTGLSLAFATIPEELPIIITMVLALGGYRLSKQHAIIKKLQAVETLGAVTVIVTDKTGTLTENKMRVASTHPRTMESDILRMATLSSDAIEDGSGLGDPMEQAIIAASRENGMDPAEIRRSGKLVSEYTFDPTRNMMSVVLDVGNGHLVASKGAPEAIIARSTSKREDGQVKGFETEEKNAFLAQASELAEKGYRVLGVAEKVIAAAPNQSQAETDLTFLGLIAFADPPRPEIKEAIDIAHKAGIRVIMVTGDHPATARSIAEQVGLQHTVVITGEELGAMSDETLAARLDTANVFARSSPEHKLRIVKALRAKGERVAVTGDGINDAPALAAADIGVAMGQTGSDVAREQADIVLEDDDFATITRSIREGRKLFDNLSKGVKYYLACKVALISAFLITVVFTPVSLLAPLQIILLELFMDLGASAAFVAERAESDVMERPPRDPKKPFLDRGMVSNIFLSAAGLCAAVTIAFLMTWYRTDDLALSQTMAFVTWLFGHIALAFNMRSDREPVSRMGVGSNRTMLLWAAAALLFTLAVVLIPSLHQSIKTTSLGLSDWLLALALALVGTFWIEAKKLVLFRR
jgi:Ca2+-transporting ATPase